MKLTLRQLAVFDAVARHGTVSAAAREVNLSQSSASLALQDLERALGVTLFIRNHRRLDLNENGRRLQPRARSMLQLRREIEFDELSAESSGVLHLGASPNIGNYLMPAICAGFRERYPNVQLNLLVAEEPEIIERVDEIALDLGFIEGGSLRHMLHTEPWLDDELVIFCHPEHWAAGRNVGIGRLIGETWCLQPIGAPSRHEFTHALLRDNGTARVGFETNSTEALKHAVCAGSGLGCLSRLAVQNDLKAGRLAEIRIRGLKMQRTFNILARKDVYHGLLQEEFRTYARAWRPGQKMRNREVER